MATRWFGAPVQRTEDPRLLRGKGSFVDDIDLPDMLHAAVLRSPHARARIISIDPSAARELPGVHLVLTAADLGEVLEPSPLLIPHHALTQPRTHLLDIDAGTYSHTQRPGRYFPSSRTQSAGNSARCWRRLRPENHALLPRRNPDALCCYSPG